MLLAPFRGLLFNPEVVPDVGQATCPPYDVIDEEHRRAYRAASPHNVVRLLLAEPGDARYQQARALLQAWRRDGVLLQDPEPRLYVYRMDYTDRAGAVRRAVGVVGALQLHPLGEQVRPHEETMAKTRADRMSVLAATEANLDLIMALSPAEELPALLAEEGEVRVDFTADGVRHRLSDISQPDGIEAVGAAVSAHPVSIADGHHRYVTALRYQQVQRQQNGPGGWDAIMAFVAPAEGGGLSVEPVHRILDRVAFDRAALSTHFTMEEAAAAVPDEPGAVVLVPGADHRSPPLLLRPTSRAFSELPPSWQAASSAVAQRLLWPLLGVDESDARYSADQQKVLADLEAEPRGAAVLMASVPPAAIAAATEAGINFPQKTTFFVPKARAGLVLRSLR